MQINVSGHHVEVTAPLRDYVVSKLGRLEKREARITHADVVLNVEKLCHRIDATIRMAGGELVATAEADDMYAAIDALSDKLDRQLDKHKGKVQGRQHVSPER
ncbi:MAG: ribosome-associated translation inhibitor RaiA [Pseudomonadales bacterium]|nr:ribosome-associated translation inhibitor RaiA [Pseudomonadales bacterium]MCP5336414.1 ribosome-associated translation inhibitor RaiA [Pseudomonadales bacterium]